MRLNSMKGRRAMGWRFQSLQELIRHFENRLSIREIESVIRESGQIFICRVAATSEQERLTFLKRCHEALQGTLLIQEEEFAGEVAKTRA